jgi:hypothetical protein
MNRFRVLTQEQVDSFMTNGYLVVHDCFDHAVADRWIDEAYDRLSYRKDDPSTWAKDIVWMDHKNRLPIRTVAPKAWNAILDVIGGEDRLAKQVLEIPGSGHFSSVNSFEWSDAFIVNFRRGADKPWQPPAAEIPGWHIDGAYFRHFLDSPEQALLTIVLWSDMNHQGGGTFIVPDSVRVVARLLRDHPEGIPPGDFDMQDILSQCTEFVELTGKTGDFVILHPYMVHASSQNVLRRPRFMTNPPVILENPMNFNRQNPADFSLLERATLHYLGVDRLDFRPAAPREGIWHWGDAITA